MMAECYGQPLDSHTIERGLHDLNPDLTFDLAARRGQLHPFINQRQGVYYLTRHICSMDRGVIPEFKEWTTVDAIVEVPWAEADREDVWQTYVVVAPDDTPDYAELCLTAARGTRPDLAFRADGQLIRISCRAVRRVPGRVTRVGWRHTFERLVNAGIPGVTRRSLAAKFGVNMDLRPANTPEGFFMSTSAV